MLKKLDNNVSYILKEKTPKIIRIWLIILIVNILIIFFILLKYEYNKVNSYIGYIKKTEDYRLYVYVKANNVSSLNTSKLLIDNKEYYFEITNISFDYYLVDNDNYYLIELNLILEDKYLINNNIIDVIIKGEKTTLLKEWKKGIDL